MHVHMIQNGENLFSISSKYKLSVSRLIEENQLTSPYETLVGQSIICSHPTRTHTVKGGDSMASICRSYGISMRALLQQNPNILQNSALFPGQNIVITPEQPTFGTLCVCGYLQDGKSYNKASLPYLTTLTLDGCKIGNGKILLPKLSESIRKEEPAPPVLLAGIEADILFSFLAEKQENAKKLIQSLKDTALGGIDVKISVLPSLTEELFLLPLHRQLRENGLSIWLHTDKAALEMPENRNTALLQLADGVLSRSKDTMGFLQRMEALQDEAEADGRFSLFPALPTYASETVTLASGEKTKFTIAFEEAIKTAHKRCEAITREPGSHLASYGYTSGAGRRKKKHRVYMEDAFSFWIGMLEMNRRGVLGVTVDATLTPISFLLMLSLKWHLLK